ncbi:unnamed protein product [Protopolystoma xenopodis]|uniref:non-specific serine/threonine protein kinase n=1 Tax=Protopolystoma xenopodis TaxID=117903 RepID=A0A3S5A6U8_9PLAT|nr:unnamed protein product [Protopolystoma xenopodis]
MKHSYLESLNLRNFRVMKNNDAFFELNNYAFIKAIGKGSYGEVWLCQNGCDKKQYVIKKIYLQKTNEKERNAANLECKLLAQLKHPNIVQYKDSFEFKDNLYIAMSFCEGGDLYTRLRNQNGVFLDERQLVEWFVQIAIALQYMHERNVLHRDLKTQNIFLTRSKIIKVGDLGIARVLESSHSMATTMIGTPYYMSPELFANKPYNHKSDIWALGCVVYEMATLKHAFNAKSFNSLSYKILSGKIPEMPKEYSLDLINLIRAMLNLKPEKRPSARRILSDAFIRSHIVLFLELTKDKSKSANPKTCMDSSASSSLYADGGDTSSSTPLAQEKLLPIYDPKESYLDKERKKTEFEFLSPVDSILVRAVRLERSNEPIEGDSGGNKSNRSIFKCEENSKAEIDNYNLLNLDARQRRRERRRVVNSSGKKNEHICSYAIKEKIVAFSDSRCILFLPLAVRKSLMM